MNSGRIESQSDFPDDAVTNADVAAVIVTYNPTPSLERNVQALLPQVGKLIIVDNGSSADARSLIAQIGSACKAEIVWNDRNLGIADGLNVGIERVWTAGQYSWIATFDQDSLVPPDFVTAILEAYSACSFRKQVAMIGARYQLAMRAAGSEPISVRNGPVFREVRTLMTSGSFLKTSVLGECGRFDHSLFMDYVDHDFCLRLRRHGFKVIQANRALLAHQLGSPTSHSILCKRFMVTNYSPSRRYSNARNRLIVYRRYLTSDSFWILRDIFEWCREIVKMMLVEQNRAEKLVSLLRGCWDGIREPRVAEAGPTMRLKSGAAAPKPIGKDSDLGG